MEKLLENKLLLFGFGIIYVPVFIFTIWYTHQVIETHAIVPTNSTFFNWDSTIGCTPMSQLMPTSVKEVATHVKNSGSARITPVGAQYSFTGAACSDGILLDLRNLQGVVDIDMEEETVTVLTGTTLDHLSEALEKWDMSLAVVPRVTAITVGGAIATGTHGTTLQHGSFSSLVTEFWIVDGQGEIQHVQSAAASELFTYGRLGGGLLGIMVQVTIKVSAGRPLIRRREAVIPIADSLQALKYEAEKNEKSGHVTVQWLPYSDTSCLITMRPVEDEDVEQAKEESENVDDFQKEMFHKQFMYRTIQIFGWITSMIPAALPLLQGSVLQGAFLPKDLLAPYYQGLTWPDSSSHTMSRYTSSEWCIPIDKVTQVWTDYNSVLTENKCPANYLVTVTVQAADDIPHSAAYQRDVACFDFTMSHNELEFQRCLPKVEEVFTYHDGKPQWFSRISEGFDFKSVYGEETIAAIQQITAAVDPKGKFESKAAFSNFCHAPKVNAAWSAE